MNRYEERRIAIQHTIERLLAERFHITHTTVQMECSGCANGPILRELNHQPPIVCIHER
jgi:cobalt-zinc-cadmium efflux system protein